MKMLVQRVKHAKVSVEGKTTGDLCVFHTLYQHLHALSLT